MKLIAKMDIVSKRGHARIMREVNRASGQRHIDERLPRHFAAVPETTPGSGGYRYRRRSAGYSQRKLRKHGHRKPNVFTGELRDSVLSKAKLTATQHKWRVVSRGTMGSRLQDWQRAEIQAVSNRERKREYKLMRRHYLKLAQDPKNQDRRKTKGLK